VFSAHARDDVPAFEVPAGYADQGSIEGVPQVPAAPSPPKPLDVRAFRRVCEASETPEEFHARLQKLMKR
jgi:hypothetical protein